MSPEVIDTMEEDELLAKISEVHESIEDKLDKLLLKFAEMERLLNNEDAIDYHGQ